MITLTIKVQGKSLTDLEHGINLVGIMMPNQEEFDRDARLQGAMKDDVCGVACGYEIVKEKQ